jgi:hypothetical protein
MRVRTAMAAIAAMVTCLGGQAMAGDHPPPVEPAMVDAARDIQSACLSRGEDSRVCSCGVGLAYAQLEPKVFKLMPKIDPLLGQKDQTAALMGLISIASQSGIGISDLQSAYQTIRANRGTMNAICKPLALIKKPTR